MNLAVLLEPASAHVLVVDDDPDLLRLLSLRLRSNGYRVSTVDSAEAALAHVAVERPDLVLSDVRLPGRDGLALFDELRAHYPALPVILLTAHGTIPDAVAATARGVFGYLTKPFDSQALLATDQIIFGIIVIGLIGLVSDLLFKLVNRRLFPWAALGK